MLTEGIFPTANCLKFAVSKGLVRRARRRPDPAPRHAPDRPFASSRPPPDASPPTTPSQSTGIVAGAVLVKVPRSPASSPTAPSPASARRCLIRGAQRHRPSRTSPSSASRSPPTPNFSSSCPEPHHPVPHRLLRRTSRGRHRVARRRNVPAIVAYAVVAGSASGVVSGSHLEAAYNCTTAVLIAGRARKFWPIIARSTGSYPSPRRRSCPPGPRRAYSRRRRRGSASTVGAYLASAAMNWIILAQMVAYKGAAGERRRERKRRSEGGGGVRGSEGGGAEVCPLFLCETQVATTRQLANLRVRVSRDWISFACVICAGGWMMDDEPSRSARTCCC